MIHSRWLSRAATTLLLIGVSLSPLTAQAQTAAPTQPPTTAATATSTATLTASAPAITPATPALTSAATVAVTSVPTSAATIAATGIGTSAATSGATVAASLAATAAGTSATTAAANSITIDGSKIVSSLVSAASDAYAKQTAGFKADVQVSGTSSGFDRLCSGALDVAMATAGVSDAQVNACSAGKVSFVELLIGFNAAVIVTNNASKVTCVDPAQVAALLTPAAAGTVKDFNQLAAGTTTPQAAQPISAVYAGQDVNARTLISVLVPGQTLRTDFNVQPDGATAIDKLVADANGVAIVTLAEFQKAQASGKAVRALSIGSGTSCTAADPVDLEQGRYAAGQPLYLYVNAVSLSRTPVSSFLTYLVGKDGQAAVTTAGFTPANETDYTRDQTYLAAQQTGRTFSRISSVNIPATTTGAVTIDGAPELHDALTALGTGFQPLYGKIALTQTLFGNDEGFQKLCAGSIDLSAATRLPTADETAACQKTGITPLPLTLGTSGVVLLINPKNTWATCLTLDQIAKLFGIAADGKVKKWSDVDAKFPATDLLILSPADGDQTTDLLILKSVKGTAPVARTDMTVNADPLYRAAGTANVDGAITYMSYADYRKVQSKITPVQVNSGAGCIAPTDKTLADGTYPLAQSQYIFLNQKAFARPEVKAFVWYFLSDDALAVLQTKSTLIGLDRAGFQSTRDKVLTLFSTVPTQTPTITPTLIPTIKAP